jgi:hypothetical protein
MFLVSNLNMFAYIYKYIKYIPTFTADHVSTLLPTVFKA